MKERDLQKYVKAQSGRSLKELAAAKIPYEEMKPVEKARFDTYLAELDKPPVSDEPGLFKKFSATVSALGSAAYGKVIEVKETVIEMRNDKIVEGKLNTLKDCKRALAILKVDLDCGEMSREDYEEAVEEIEDTIKTL